MQIILKMKFHVKVANNRGFTLLEALIATMVLAVGILAVGQMQITAISGNSVAQTVTDIKGWTTDRFESMMSEPEAYEKSAALTDNDPDLAVGQVHTGPALPPGYTMTWTVTEGAIMPETKLITITVTGQRFGQTKRIRFDYVM
ncbi:MAG: prepilin-type N-terminal cleavage/methylation domain-containing protein [Desulfobacteraceae bacterium]|nr:MAG: prepilin-type N-terminal cleavage/methylation domain-containing protein [Desulfobacteraceae bacterium]